MYVMQTHRETRTQHLFEMSAREFAETQVDASYKPHVYSRVGADLAHRYVKSGGCHSTLLWVDHNQRIRRAGG